MSNQEIIARLSGVCDALEDTTVHKGIRNSSNITASYAILREIIQAINVQEESESASENE
jgi:hypothetical protein